MMFTYYLRKTLRDKAYIFWSLAFPILLMTCFNVTFMGPAKGEIDFKPVKSTMIRTFIRVGELAILPELMEFGYSIDISGHQGSMLRSDTKQVLPPAGSYSMQLYDGGKYRNASITADETAVGWEFI